MTETTVEYDYAKLDRMLEITKSKVFLDKRAAFFGSLISSLNFRWNPNIPTAQTNGIDLEWNPADFLECTPDQRVSTIMHELWHVARMHMLRCGGRCPDVWNQACDILINDNMVRDGYQGVHPPLFILNPGLAALDLEEKIYDALPKNGGGGNCGVRCHHGSMPLPAGAQSKAVNNVVKAITNAKMEGKPGSIPGNTEEIINKFLAPKIPWEQHVAQWMTDLLEEDFTWARPNRRYTEMYLPSRFEDEGRLAHLIHFQDVSGSVTHKESLRFNSELKHLWEVFKPLKMTIVQFDTIIQKVDVLEDGDPFTEIKIIGRGGTHLGCVRQMIIDEQPTAAIIFSDMEVEPMEPLPFTIPILWVSSSGYDKDFVIPPGGKKIRVEV